MCRPAGRAAGRLQCTVQCRHRVYRMRCVPQQAKQPDRNSVLAARPFSFSSPGFVSLTTMATATTSTYVTVPTSNLELEGLTACRRSRTWSCSSSRPAPSPARWWCSVPLAASPGGQRHLERLRALPTTVVTPPTAHARTVYGLVDAVCMTGGRRGRREGAAVAGVSACGHLFPAERTDMALPWEMRERR